MSVLAPPRALFHQGDPRAPPANEPEGGIQDGASQMLGLQGAALSMTLRLGGYVSGPQKWGRGLGLFRCFCICPEVGDTSEALGRQAVQVFSSERLNPSHHSWFLVRWLISAVFSCLARHGDPKRCVRRARHKETTPLGVAWGERPRHWRGDRLLPSGKVSPGAPWAGARIKPQTRGCYGAWQRKRDPGVVSFPPPPSFSAGGCSLISW